MLQYKAFSANAPHEKLPLIRLVLDCLCERAMPSKPIYF